MPYIPLFFKKQNPLLSAWDKVDKAIVEAQIVALQAGKIDTTVINAIIATINSNITSLQNTKVDITTFNTTVTNLQTNINTKADTSSVNASISTINSSIASKADIIYVDNKTKLSTISSTLPVTDILINDNFQGVSEKLQGQINVVKSNKNTKIFITVGVNDTNADFNTANYSTGWGAIVAAYNFAKTNNIKTVFVKNGVYTVINGGITAPRLQPANGINLIGESKQNTIILGTRANDWIIINRDNSNVAYIVDAFKISNFTFDLNNITAGSGIRLDSCIENVIENCHFQNGAVNSWFVSWGAINSTNSNDRGLNNKEINCTYDTHQGSLEMVLVYNQDNYLNSHPFAKNKGTITTGPVIGLWQNCNNALIDSPFFQNNNGFNYYSVTCDNARWSNVFAQNMGCILQGANVSDNTEFGPKNGFAYAKGLCVKGFTALGGSNSSTTSAIQLGAVMDYNLEIDYIDNYEIGIQFFAGNNQNYATPYKGNVSLGIIKNCNPNNNFHSIHPALYFGKAGNYDLTINGGEIYDDRNTPFQRNPITFEDSHVEPNINFTVTSGVITDYGIVSGGSNLPKARDINYPLILNLTGGSGANITAYTNNSGVITQINIINGGSGFTTPVLSPISTFIYSNIRIINSKLISYNSVDSITKMSNPILDIQSIEFLNIRNAQKGSLSNYYDNNITSITNNAISTAISTTINPSITSAINSISDANSTTRGFVNINNQQFSGRKEFNSNDTWFGTGINNSASVYTNIGNLGTNTTNYIRCISSTVANISLRLEPKGLGRVETQNGGLVELKLTLTNQQISANSINNVALFTVPAGRSLILTKALLRTATITGTVTVAPFLSIGANASTFDDFMATTQMVNTIIANRAFIFTPNGSEIVYPAGTVINIATRTTQSGASALTYDVDLFGYLL